MFLVYYTIRIPSKLPGVVHDIRPLSISGRIEGVNFRNLFIQQEEIFKIIGITKIRQRVNE